MRSPTLQGEQRGTGSGETRRWIIPKGWPKRGKSPHRSEAREAFEEAGIVGAVGRRPVGSFSYEKRLKNGRSVECEVRVFPLGEAPEQGMAGEAGAPG